MPRKKRTLIDRIILYGTVALAAFLLILWLSGKRKGRDYYFPAGYSGWVSIKYQVPGAPPLEQADGRWQLHLPDSGYLVTSTPLETGWGRDRYFFASDTGWVSIPSVVTLDDQQRLHIHSRDFRYFSHEELLPQLPVGTDTVMWDGSHIEKISDREVSYRTGNFTLEYFYLSNPAVSIDFRPPPNPRMEGLNSTRDRAISTGE